MIDLQALTVKEVESRVWTAWELGSDWWWMGKYTAHTTRTKWGEINISRGYQGVRLSRLESDLRVFTRYVRPETPMRLKYNPDHDPTGRYRDQN